MLHRRCNIDANEAIRGALGIMDEVLTDLLISPEALQVSSTLDLPTRWIWLECASSFLYVLDVGNLRIDRRCI